MSVLVALLLAAAWLVLTGRRQRMFAAMRRAENDAGLGRSGGFRRRTARRGAEERVTADLLAFLDVLAPGLRAGRTPEEAVRAACEVVGGTDVVDAIGDAARHSRPIGAVLERQATDRAEVRLLAQAWTLSARTGCPLAEAVECSARGLRSTVEHRRRTVTASAGATATIRLLTLLPLGGPFLAVAVGVDPVVAYGRSPLAWACLVAGALLVVAGRAWVRRLVASVARGPVLG